MHGAHKGMTRDELKCSMGDPEAINDYGDAGDQWVYENGRTFVYLDGHFVRDVQRLRN
jgi:hypothetical protein